MTNVAVKPVILKCRSCNDERGAAQRYEMIFVPPLPHAYRLYLCAACLRRLHATLGEIVTRRDGAA